MSTVLISILSGLGGMFGWGVSDYFANLSSDKIGNIKTLFWSQVAAFGLIALVIFSFRPTFNLTPVLITLITLSSFGFTVGYLYLYKAFEVGNVSVASVVINFNAVLTMLVAYFIYGQRLSGLQIPAVILIILGIMLVSVDFKDLLKGSRNFLLNGAKEALISSVAFGIFYWPVTEYIVERANWLWTALIVKILTVILVFAFSFFRKDKINLKSEIANMKWLLIVVGLLEALAILSVNYGISVGDSILISPIANSVAVVTVTLAVIFLKEKLTKLQVTGIVSTILGIVLTAF